MDRSEELFHAFQKGGFAYIQSLIGVQEENEILDFKQLTGASFPLHKQDRQNISTLISAFANNSGGVIVLGVEARKGIDGKDVAQQVVPIGNLKALHTTLLSVIPQITAGGLLNISYEIVEQTQGSDSGCLVISVPATQGDPVKAVAEGIHKYFVRNGAMNADLSHSQLSDMFGRRPQPKLKLTWHVQPLHGEPFQIQFALENCGRAIAKYPAVRFYRSNTFAPGSIYLMPPAYTGTPPPYNFHDEDPFQESRLLLGTADQFVHVGSKQWICYISTSFSMENRVFNDIFFDYEVFCDGAYDKAHMQITESLFREIGRILN